jgi:hypothetical protein
VSRIRKPCPCCKKVNPRRPANDICYDCRRTFEFAEKLVAEEKLKVDSAEDVGVFKCRDLECWHWWPHYWRDLPKGTDSGAHERFRKAMHRLASLLASPADQNRLSGIKDRFDLPYIYGEKQHWDGSAVYVTVPRVVAAALVELDAAQRNLMCEAGRAAFDSGRSLLVSLAAGTTSIADFDKEVTQEGKRR